MSNAIHHVYENVVIKKWTIMFYIAANAIRNANIRRLLRNPRMNDCVICISKNRSDLVRAPISQFIRNTHSFVWSSYVGRRADALALRADERRDKLRKASGSGKYALIRRYLNGETHMSKPHVSIHESIVYGGEPGELKHLSSRRKRKKHRFWE